MQVQERIDFNRIAQAISYIADNFRAQPGLEEIARSVHVSPAHFHRMFTEWAGTSPKKFLQYISVEHAKQVLKAGGENTLADAAFETGLSSTSRLHDLFVRIEGMSPAEYKRGGRALTIRYHFGDSLFGKLIIASTSRGICHLAFEDDPVSALARLSSRFPHATLRHQTDPLQENALRIFGNDRSRLPLIKLHLKGTDFQLKVWESLLKIPMGRLATYGAVAAKTGNPRASRAVGAAIGSNPVAFLIPCHRVIQSSGALGGYVWGSARKAALIGWEAARMASRDSDDQADNLNLMEKDGFVQ